MSAACAPQARPKRAMRPIGGPRRRTKVRRASGSFLAAAAAALALACTAALAQPDPGKTLRVAFLIAETGFDPQASSDLYSNYVNRVMFDPPFRMDYLARPHRPTANTAVAMPACSAARRASCGSFSIDSSFARSD